MTEEFIERRIVLGLIISTEYIQKIRGIWDSKLLEASTARTIAGWCMDYFDQYHKAPNKDIQSIYNAKLKGGLSQEEAEWIEGVLDNLSKEYERDNFNTPYLIDQTKKYFQERSLWDHIDTIKGALENNELIEAEKEAYSYSSILKENQSAIDPFSKEAVSIVKKAFKEREKPLIKFPKALGDFWGSEFVRGAFVAILGMEKKGKTFVLIEIAIRAIKSKCNVVFFQAGDMTEEQQIRRLGVYLTKRSDQPRYCKGMFLPTIDCLYNQIDTCNEEMRECDFGIFKPEDDVKGAGLEILSNLYRENKDYVACHNCDKISGVPWLKWREEVPVLKWTEAYRAFREFQKKHNARFKLSTHANETLRISEIKSLLRIWEKEEGFVPDLIIIDYADIMAPDPDCTRLEFRNQTNKIWQRLRNLSQEQKCLVVTATQAAASSYDHNLLRLSDFSEDKRKFAHVTAMYGLNQTSEEKKIGIMRLNEMVVRDADFDSKQTIKVLQRLQIGRPFLGSFK